MILKTLRRNNSVDFLIHGTNFQSTHESKHSDFICLNSKLRKTLNFDLENLLGKNAFCYGHFKG